METISSGSKGAAVEDIQRRLQKLGYDLGPDGVDGVFGEGTARAIREFRASKGLPQGDTIDTMTWAALVDSSFMLGDRTLYLRMPYFHGNDVAQLQNILNVLGFACGPQDGMFGAFTESAVRDFQINMGIEPDGIVGMATVNAINRLQHAWDNKQPMPQDKSMQVFSRAVDVLESTPVCVYGVDDISRQIASRIANLAFATTNLSKLVSVDMISGELDSNMFLVEIDTTDEVYHGSTPTVIFDNQRELSMRFANAVSSLEPGERVVVKMMLPEKLDGEQNLNADTGLDGNYMRGLIQHNAIMVLDAICYAFSQN